MGIKGILENLTRLTESAGEEQERRARIFMIASGVTTAALIIFLFYYGLFVPSYNLVPIIVLLTVAIISLILNRRGSTDLAVNLLAWTTLASLFTLALVNDGLYDTALEAIPALLIVVSVLLKKRPLVIFSLSCLGLLVVVGVLQVNDVILNHPRPPVSATSIFDLIVINGTTVVLILLVASYLREIVGNARDRQARLGESEERFRTLFDHTADGFEVIDTNGRLIDVNSAAMHQLGYSRDELLTLNVFDIDPELTPDRLEKLKTELSDEAPLRFESVRQRNDGSVFPVELSVSLIRRDGNSVFLIEVRDITERKRSDRELLESQQQLSTIYAAVGEVLYYLEVVSDGVYRFLSVNKAFCTSTGLSEKQVVGKLVTEIIPDSSVGAVLENYRQAIDGNRTVRWEEISEYPTGRLVGAVSITPILNENGVCTHLVGSVNDISERKLAEEAIQESEEKFRQLTEKSVVGIFVIQNASMVYVNPCFAEIFGYTPDEIIGKLSAKDLIHPDDVQTVIQRIGQRTEGLIDDSVISYRGIRKDGSHIFIEVFGLRSEYRGKPAVMGTLIDITQRKQSELMLQKYQLLSESARDIILFINADDLQIVEANEAAQEAYGFSHDELLQKRIGDLRHPETLSHLPEQLDTVFAEGLSFKTVHCRRDGTSFPVEVNSRGMIVGDRRMLVSVIRDITERQKAEETLREREKQYRSLFENMHSGFILLEVILDEGGNPFDHRLLDANREFEQQTGLSRSTEIGLTSSELSFKWPSEITQRYYDIAMNGGRLHYERFNESLQRHYDIRVFSPIKGQFAMLFNDITDRKLSEQEKEALQKQLIQSQKMESVGLLAGGIAHDINNILSIVSGNIELLNIGGADSEKFKKRVTAIDNAVERGASLVRQLLTFARKTETMTKPLQINEIVEDVQKLLLETFPKTIGISTHLQPLLPKVVADPTQIHQVILNLCINSRDAMPGGGTLTLSTRAVSGKVASTTQPHNVDVEYIEIQVQDTGIGMDESTRQRIFEPFFTTKDIGKGTGLGLALVYGIVQRHHGLVEVSSRPGTGTVVTVYLPIGTESTEVTETVEQTTEEVPGGTETILLIEDEKELRDTVEEYLSTKGYTVLTAEDGIDGVTVYTKFHSTIDLVITDLGLPKLNGEEVLRQIRAVDPAAKVILASGFVEPERRARLDQAGADSFVNKPYKQIELLTKIQQALHSNH